MLLVGNREIILIIIQTKSIIKYYLKFDTKRIPAYVL